MILHRAIGLMGLLAILAIASCNEGSGEQKTALTRDEEIRNNIASLKEQAQEGDLLVRMTDDIISVQVKNFNQTDKSFSHAGIVVLKDGEKMICHISPDQNRTDTVRFDPIDSFINPGKHLSAALFRYELSKEERTALGNELENYHRQKVHFDWKYDLDSDTAIYCSEMIAKTVSKVTNERILFTSHLMPARILPLLNKYFEGKVSPEQIAKRKFLAIDNLYLVPGCTEIMRFKLKYLPGQ